MADGVEAVEANIMVGAAAAVTTKAGIADGTVAGSKEFNIKLSLRRHQKRDIYQH